MVIRKNNCTFSKASAIFRTNNFLSNFIIIENLILENVLCGIKAVPTALDFGWEGGYKFSTHIECLWHNETFSLP